MDRHTAFLLLVVIAVIVSNVHGEMKPCEFNQCMNGGKCYSRVSGASFGDITLKQTSGSYFFGLAGGDGFNGIGNVGNNNGGETNYKGDFICECPGGFDGPTCEKAVNPCVSSPCSNAGACHSWGHSFRCICLPGFSGPRCQHHNIQRRSLGPSDSNSMAGGHYGNINHNHTSGSFIDGQSTMGIGSGNGNGNTGNNIGNTNVNMSNFYCDCNAAFGRNWRDYGRSGCANDLRCVNQGTCYNFNDGSGNSYCSCPPGFSGTQCQVAITATPGSVRLIGGQKPWNGRVEINEGGSWRTVCSQGWGQNNAEVVCRQLGFRGVQESYQRFGQGGLSQAVWSRNARCFGGELRLADCPFSVVSGTCGHEYDVGLDCRPF